MVGYPEYDKERWKAAVDAALDVIKLNRYAIYTRHIEAKGYNPGKLEPGWGFYAIFHNNDFCTVPDGANGVTYTNGSYCEMIFECRPGEGNQREALFGPPTCGGNGNGGYIYHDLVEQFPMKDGKPIGTSSEYPYDPMNPAEGRDPRFANTVVWNGSVMMSGGDKDHIVYTHKGVGATTDAFGSGTPTGYYIRKFSHRQLAGNWFVGTSQAFDLIRYAEILLNYAEAVNEYYGPDHEDVLGEYTISPLAVLKLLRERAGIDAGKDGRYGLAEDIDKDYVKMRDAIRLERRIELAFEGHRFFDVRRWMIAEETENKQMHGFEITKSITEKGKKVPVRKHTFRKAMYFLPIPYKETVKSDDLVQNPYYE